MQIEKLKNSLAKNNQPQFRLKQISKAIYQDGVFGFSEITTISKDLRQSLEKEIALLSFKSEKILVSKDKKSIKALLKLADGNLIETVLLSPTENSWSVCVSTQIGCPIGCRFCATGNSGFKRNLTAEEITDQVLFWRQYLRNKIQETRYKKHTKEDAKIKSHVACHLSHIANIVYMGMGEPFLNWLEVSMSFRDLINPELFGFGSRSISVSTSGIPEGIEKLAEEFPQINLAVSLHFGSDEKRSENMPINKKNNLESLRQSLINYFKKTKRKVFLEYVMLSGINDSKDDADKLMKFVRSIGKLQLLHVNLISYNTTEAEFRASSKEKVRQFRDYLEQNRISVTIRKSLGEEIQGACGQLVAKN